MAISPQKVQNCLFLSLPLRLLPQRAPGMTPWAGLGGSGYCPAVCENSVTMPAVSTPVASSMCCSIGDTLQLALHVGFFSLRARMLEPASCPLILDCCSKQDTHCR